MRTARARWVVLSWAAALAGGLGAAVAPAARADAPPPPAIEAVAPGDWADLSEGASFDADVGWLEAVDAPDAGRGDAVFASPTFVAAVRAGSGTTAVDHLLLRVALGSALPGGEVRASVEGPGGTTSAVALAAGDGAAPGDALLGQASPFELVLGAMLRFEGGLGAIAPAADTLLTLVRFELFGSFPGGARIDLFGVSADGRVAGAGGHAIIDLGPGGTAVPEPGTLGLCALAVGALVARRSRAAWSRRP